MDDILTLARELLEQIIPGCSDLCAGDDIRSLAQAVIDITHERDIISAVAESHRAVLHDVATSGVEFSDARVDYVTVQIDTATWQAVQQFHAETDDAA